MLPSLLTRLIIMQFSSSDPPGFSVSLLLYAASIHALMAAGFGSLVVSPLTDIHVIIWERHALIAAFEYVPSFVP